MRLLAALALWLLLAAAHPVALTGVTVIDGTGAPPRPRITVVLDGDRIAAVFPDGEWPLPCEAWWRGHRP